MCIINTYIEIVIFYFPNRVSVQKTQLVQFIFKQTKVYN
jgi:hypothetical protein